MPGTTSWSKGSCTPTATARCSPGRLRADHRGPTHAYYLHVPFEQTLLRHATKPIANEFGEAQLRDWYRELDLLPGGIEAVIGADSTLREIVDRIMLDTGLAGMPALDL